ncbi:MAG: hypothetical protein FGM15_11940 [Chthoniobacterales bacterium]|nr:hypothetical protein [Chthoniobacterales bacterium]
MQEIVHQLEVGALKPLILRGIFLAVIAGLATLYLIFNFRGLDSETAMDQAQIGRQLAAGAGFSTLYIRPMAIWQFLGHSGKLPEGVFPDTYNFPLNPLLDAVVLRPVKRWWPMEPSDVVYIGDRVIAAAGICLFLVSVAIFFFLIRGLFDARIAWMTTVMVVLCDMMWRFSVSGLPQMLMLFFFSLALLLLRGAIAARESKRTGRMLLHLTGIALLLGLMTLAQPLASWIFLGFLIAVFAFFPPRTLGGFLVIIAYAAVIAPWLVRNYLVCGNPLGLTMFSILGGTTGSETSFMSNLQPDLAAFGAVRDKLRGGLTSQFENLFGFLGYNAAAAAFFFSLLHIFKRPQTSFFRWVLVIMWVFAVVGMALFAPQGAVSANQIHVLFVPPFIAFGLAFLINLWNRMDLRFPPARNAFIGLVFLISAMPMAVNLLTAPPTRVSWPPYLPPMINAVCRWMEPGEILASDMPWATAWYGGHPSLLLPATVGQYVTLHDYKVLGGPINGIYLTPVSGDRPWLSQIAKGEYKEWASFIMRTADLTRFPLKYFVPLPLDNQCVFYSSRDRWTPRESNP